MKSIQTILLFIIVLAVFTTKSYANEMVIGIQVGPTVTNVLGKNNIFKPKADIRYAAEFYFKYYISNKIAFRTGLGFEDKGYQFKNATFTDPGGNPIGTGKFQHHLQYITIPVLAEFTFGKKVQPYINTGFYFGILAKAQDISKFQSDKVKSDVTQYINRFDMGFVVGAGINVPIKEKFLFNIDIRNSIGFLRTNKNANIFTNKRYNYSTAFNFGFAYKFGNKESTSK